MKDAEAVVGLYERHALAFDRIRGRQLFERPWLDRFAQDLLPGAQILDLGCGSGEPMAAELIARGYRLTGMDSSPTLIGLCRNRFPDQQWLVGDMRDLSLDRCFQGILAWHSFFHLVAEDQRAMFARFASHAAQGAMLMFTSGPAAGVAVGSFEGEPLYHCSLGPEDYRGLLAQNGFDIVHHFADDADCGGATVWLARRR